MSRANSPFQTDRPDPQLANCSYPPVVSVFPVGRICCHPVVRREGWQGWDGYAPFYDWENVQTLGRRDVRFWQRVAGAARSPVLELGCGTGRVLAPLGRTTASPLVGIDRSAPMLERARRRIRAGRVAATRRQHVALVRGDIRDLPFSDRSFGMVLAPYGVLQSLLNDRDLISTLRGVARVLEPGGTFGIDLVPDVPAWREYRDRVRLRGRAAGGASVTLVESVRQDRRRRLTIFEQRFVEKRRGQRTTHRFELTFRTLPVKAVIGRLERCGFDIVAVLGDYHGTPWDERAETWVILAATSPRARKASAQNRGTRPLW